MARKVSDDNQLRFMLPHRNSLRPDTCKLSADQIAWLNDPFNTDGETPKDFDTFRKRYREWVIDTLPTDWRDEYTSEGYRLCHIIAAKHGGPNCMNNVFMFWAAVTRCIGARADCLNCALVGPEATQRAIAASKLASTSVRSVYKYNGEAVKMAVYRGQHWWKEYYNALTRPNGGFDSLIVANPTVVSGGGSGRRSSKLPTLMISDYGAIKRECRGIFRFRHGRKEGTPKHTKSFGYAYMLANSALQRSVDITEESYLTPPSKQSKMSSALDRNRDSDSIDIEHVSIEVERHEHCEINHSGSQSCESPSSVTGISIAGSIELRDSSAMPIDQHKERDDLQMTEMY